MELSKHHYQTFGFIVLFLGLQFRWVEDFKLRTEAQTVIQERINKDRPYAAQTIVPLNIHPPEWIGWSLLSSGLILTFASLALKSK
jgi:hypothetical protein